MQHASFYQIGRVFVFVFISDFRLSLGEISTIA